MAKRGIPDDIEFDVGVDPKEISVNLHYKHNCSTVPASVKKVQAVIQAAAAGEAERRGWSPPVGPVGVELHFTFNDLRGDGDNPIKRTIDAVQHGLGFNDSKIVEGHWYRHVGIPSVRVKVYETVHPDGQEAGKGHRGSPTFTLPDGTVVGT